MVKDLKEKIDDIWANVADAKIELKNIQKVCGNETDSDKLQEIIDSISDTNNLFQNL